MFSLVSMSGELVHEDHTDNYSTIESIERMAENMMGMPVRLMKGESILGKRKCVAETFEEGDIVCVILQPDIPHAATSRGAFAFVRLGGSLVTWGDNRYGG